MALNMPIEVNNSFCTTTWSSAVLEQLTIEMDISRDFVDAYLPTIMKESFEVTNVKQRQEQVMTIFPNLLHSRRNNIKLYIKLIMFIVTNNFYDARGRELLRNFSNALNLTTNDYVAIEVQLCKSLIELRSSLSHSTTKEKSKNSKMIRYAKIGAVAVGAGAALALTGGLAAPAIAGAFLIMGSSSVAAVASVTAVATIFGTTGAGLSGYKMLRRTRGVEEFQFEQHDAPVTTLQRDNEFLF